MIVEEDGAHSLSQITFHKNFLIFDYTGIGVHFEICCLFSKTALRMCLIFFHDYRGFSVQKVFFFFTFFGLFFQNGSKDLHNVCMIFEYNSIV